VFFLPHKKITHNNPPHNTMKHLLILLLCITTGWAQETQIPDAKEKALEKIFSTLTPEEFPAALKEARKLGLNQQVLLEAQFLHLVDQENFDAMAKLVPDLLKQRDQFNPDESEIFAVKEDWLAIIHYAQALDALQKKDNTRFKKHITEAFWLSPRQGQAFAPHINSLRMKESMAAITLMPTHPMHPQDGSPATTLGALMKDKKATVLHFWSPMSEEVLQNLDDFIQTAQSCKQNDIAVTSILVGQTPFILKDAELIRKEDGAAAECHWMTDPNKGALSNLLRITDIPTMVIISKDGKILFNGHPADENFWNQIKTIAPKFERPKQTNTPHNHAHSDG
jgi:hypothetical protein